MLDIDKILQINAADEFEAAALELFAYQARQCPPYAEYLSLIGVDPDSITRAADIPHLPIEIFKSHKVYCGSDEPEKVFTSSTTTGDTPSRHFVAQLSDYEATFMRAFKLFYGDPADWAFYCLLPGYLERQGSSLVCMADGLIRAGRGGGFFLRDHEELIDRMAADSGKKILLGVSYALWDLAENHAPKLQNTIVMETGGMKGHRAELPKDEFHDILKNAFGVAEIHSEYGMAELSSQAYSVGNGIFRTPQWLRISIRDVNNPFAALPHWRTGGVNITDLANINSCAFIQTQDLGRSSPDNSFEILGRIDNAQLRGCNLMTES